MSSHAIADAYDYLVYDPTYKVLICRECQYAIQKSAVGSHLLRHKIYRGDRQRLLDAVSQLELLEPEAVEPPPSTSLPVEGLPIIPGFRCAVDGCENLCASTKRMRRHWSESHGVRDPPQLFALPATIQTFFRGTKLRYFEVTPASSVALPSMLEAIDLNPAASTSTGFSSNAPNSPYNQSPGPGPDPDLETISSFHHFNTSMAYSLPYPAQETAAYWQVTVTALALRQSWLMCGLLALSSQNMLLLSADDTTRQTHRRRAAQYLERFEASWDNVRQGLLATQFEEAQAGAQMLSIHRCIRWRLASPQELPEMQVVLRTIVGCIDPSFVLRAETGFGDWFPENQAAIPVRDLLAPGTDNSSLVKALQSLPYRIANLAGRPEYVRDVFDTIGAVDALISSCTESYATENMQSIWIGMTSWFYRLPPHFRDMLKQHHPVALIVVAHWAVLLERTEQYCWFLQGLASKLVQRISAELPPDSALRPLLLELPSANPM